MHSLKQQRRTSQKACYLVLTVVVCSLYSFVWFSEYSCESQFTYWWSTTIVTKPYIPWYRQWLRQWRQHVYVFKIRCWNQIYGYKLYVATTKVSVDSNTIHVIRSVYWLSLLCISLTFALSRTHFVPCCSLRIGWNLCDGWVTIKPTLSNKL